MAERSTFRRAASIVMGAAGDRSAATIAQTSALASKYTLARRTAALVLGVKLPLPQDTVTSPAPSGSSPFVLTTSPSESLEKIQPGDEPSPERPLIDEEADEERGDHQRLLEALRAYAAATPAERLRQRPHALEYLKDLNGILRITRAEPALGRIVWHISGQVDPSLDLHTHQPLILGLHRDAVVYLCDRLTSGPRWQHALRQQQFRRQVTRHDGLFTILSQMGDHASDLDQVFFEWRRKMPVAPQLIDPPHSDPVEILDRVHAEPNELGPDELEDVRDALALASHDFIGDDLRDADLTKVSLRGVYWGPSTQWPTTWQSWIYDASDAVQPGVLRINDRAEIPD